MKPPYGSWEEMSQSKIFPLTKLLERVQQDRATGKTIATLNGSFDLLHSGHLYMLFEASKVADRLIVALNTDDSIGRYKSPSRPILPLSERMALISIVPLVDYVTWFDEEDPRALLEQIRPDVHVNGAEYGEHCIEADTVRQSGGRLHLVPRIPGLATSIIISKIQKL